jgi:hypothetical protein
MFFRKSICLGTSRVYIKKKNIFLVFYSFCEYKNVYISRFCSLPRRRRKIACRVQFGVQSLRRQWKIRIVRVPNCLGAEMSHTGAEVSWCRIVPVPKCLAFDKIDLAGLGETNNRLLSDSWITYNGDFAEAIFPFSLSKSRRSLPVHRDLLPAFRYQ